MITEIVDANVVSKAIITLESLWSSEWCLNPMAGRGVLGSPVTMQSEGSHELGAHVTSTQRHLAGLAPLSARVVRIFPMDDQVTGLRPRFAAIFAVKQLYPPADRADEWPGGAPCG